MKDTANGNGSGERTNSAPMIPEVDFGLLVETIRDYAIFMLTPTGRIASWNAGAAALKGYTAEEIIGSHFSCFYPADQIARGWPQHELDRAAADGRFEDEAWRIRKDGSRFWANVVITALRDSGGALVGFAKVTRDLTDRHAQAEALRESEQRFRALVDGVSDYAIYMLDPNGLVTTWNSGAERVKGYTASEVVGTHMSRFYPPEAIKRKWPEHELQKAAVEGRFEDEGWRVRKDGSRFWANVIITAVRDAGGMLRGFAKVTRDLTERRAHEEALKKSEERFRLLVEGVDDYAIVMLDTTGIVTSWNTGAHRMKGYTPAEVIGKHFSHFYTSEDIAADRPWKDLAVARSAGRFGAEGWRVRKDGTLFWANSTINALHDADGHLYGYASVTQDLTHRRHAETLADTTQRMHEFIAMLAHELRNPLAPIRNAVALMGLKGLADPTLESMRQTIDRQSSHLTRIIDELLDVNRIARGKLTVDKQSLSLGELLERAIETSRPLIDAMGHRFHTSLPTEEIRLHGDALRLSQAIVNILNNAAKYTPAGGDIWLTVRARGTDVEIRVRDTGNGIARADLDRVFDLFTQVRRDAAGEGGLGVGLALVRRVVELHAGTVHAKSAGPGKGSEFIVRLPLPVRQPQSVAAAGPLEEAQAAQLRVLVVDDNRDAADSLHLLLEQMGHQAYTVYDGRAALAAVTSFRPDVILLDIGMPHMSGYDVARELTAQPRETRPVLVAVTGWGQRGDRERSRAAGFDYHYAKPLANHTLEAVLAEIAARRDGRAS